MHVFCQNTANTSVFEELVQKHCKMYHFGHVAVKVSQIAVFLLRWLFWLFQNIVNTNVLARFWGSEGEQTL